VIEQARRPTTLDQYVDEIAEQFRASRAYADDREVLDQIFKKVQSRPSLTIANFAPLCETQPENILDLVAAQHDDGTAIAAADTLLNYVLGLLEADDFDSLNYLVGLLEKSLVAPQNERLYDDHGLARVHNVLALTYKHAPNLKRREKLRETYRRRVLQREGPQAADRAVAFI
jgi:hypothetical protein